MPKLLALLLSATVLVVCERASAERPDSRAPVPPVVARDTIDFWHVYVRGRLVLRDTGTLRLDRLAPGDTLRVVYFTDAPGMEGRERLFVFPAAGRGRRGLVFRISRSAEPKHPQDVAFAVPLASLPRAGAPYRFEYESDVTPRRLLFVARYE